MNVATLILQLQTMAQPDDEVTLIVEEPFRDGESLSAFFSGKVIGTGTGAETGKCEVYGIALRRRGAGFSDSREESISR